MHDRQQDHDLDGTETSVPFASSDEMTATEGPPSERIAAEGFPHLMEVAEHASRNNYSVDTEFEFGLDLILEALAERLERGRRARPR